MSAAMWTRHCLGVIEAQRAERRTRRGGPCVRMLPSPKPPPAEAHVVRVNGRMVVAFRDPNAAWALAFTYALDGESVAVERIAEP